MKTSILILTYNKENEIPLILRSLYLQKDSISNWELVVVDDGSSDNTVIEIKKYSDKLPVKLFELKHTGNRNYNRNFGIKQCHGSRLVYLDGDIVPSHEFLKMHDSYSDEPILVLGPRFNMPEALSKEQINFLLNDKNIFMLETMPFNSDLRESYLNFDEDIINKTYRWIILHSHNFSVPLEIINKIGGFDENLKYWGVDDLELGYRFMLENLKFVYDRKCLGTHLYHKESLNNEGYKKNLALFFNKYKNNEVELFSLGIELEADALFDALKICNSTQLNVILNNASELAGIFNPDNTILNSIKINNDNGFKSVSGLGIYTENIEKKYKYSIVSGKLMKLGEAVFAIILEKMNSISDNVFILDTDKEIEANLNIITRFNSKKVFTRENGLWKYKINDHNEKLNYIFYPNDILDKFSKNYFFKLLATHLKNSTEVSSTLILKCKMFISETNDKYLDFPYEAEIPRRVLIDGRAYSFKTIWSENEAKGFNFEKTIFWDYIWESNNEELLRIEKLYDILIFMNEKDLLEYKAVRKQPEKPCFFMETFIDTNIFHPEVKKRNDKFVISIMQKNKFIIQKDASLIRAFLDEFEDNDHVLLNIYYSDDERIKFNNLAFNDALNNKWESQLNGYNILNEGHIDNQIKEYRNNKKYKNIKIIEKDLNPKELSEVMSGTDLSVCLNLPWMAQLSVACNTPVVTKKYNERYSFLKNGLVTFVEAKPVSGYICDIDLIPSNKNSLINQNNDFRKINEVDYEDFKKILKDKYNEWKSGKEPAGIINEKWLKEYSVENACGKLINFFKTIK